MRARSSHARAHVVPPPPPPPPPTLAIREKHASITDRSIHRGKFLPRHVRARPMRALTCTPPLWCRRRLARQHSSPMLPQLRQGRRRRDGDKSRSSCWLDGGDLVVPVSSSLLSPSPLHVSLPRSLTPRRILLCTRGQDRRGNGEMILHVFYVNLDVQDKIQWLKIKLDKIRWSRLDLDLFR